MDHRLGGQLGELAAAAVHQVGEQDAREGAVAGGRKAPEHQVARLLAPERQAVGVERFEDVPVADRGLAHHDAASRHRAVEPEVRHDRHRHRVPRELAALGQIGGEDDEQLVARADLALVVHRHEPVGVAVEGETEIRPVLHDRLCERLWVGRAARVVDVRAVGLARDHHAPSPRAARERRARLLQPAPFAQSITMVSPSRAPGASTSTRCSEY